MASAIVTTIGPPKWGQTYPGYKTKHHIFQWDSVSVSLSDEGLAYLVRYAESLPKRSLPTGLKFGVTCGCGKGPVHSTLDHEPHVPEDVHRTNYQGEDPDEAYDRARDDRAEQEALGEEG